MPMQHTVWQGPLPSTEIASQLRHILLGPQGEKASHQALQAEAVRIAIWSLNTSRQQGCIPKTGMSTQQVLHQTRRLLDTIFNTNQSSIIAEADTTNEKPPQEVERDMLDNLEDQGDLFSLAGGYWLPAPGRLVPLAEKQYLLVGGMPTSMLSELHSSLHLHGSFRHIRLDSRTDTPPTTKSLGTWQFQNLSNWLGPAPATLQQLINDFRAHLLQPVSSPQAVSHVMEAYVTQTNQPQAVRWQKLERVTDGRYLLRTQPMWGKREYSIGHVQNHLLTKQSETLHFMDIRRLCYALDYYSNTPTSVEWLPSQGRLTLHSELPVYERKYLASIAVLYTPQEQYYPRIWTQIAQQHHQKVEKMLRDLGLKIMC